MARAIAKGFIATNTVRESNIIASATTEKTLAVWKDMGCQTTLINKEVVENSNLVFLAVKPYLIVPVAKEIMSSIDTSRHLVVSVAAAITTDAIEESLPPNTRVIRANPNLACSVQCGALAFCKGRCALAEDVRLIKRLLQTSGMCVEVKESQMNAITAVGGSALAFFFLAIEAMSDGGVRVGLPRALSMDLASQTVLGAARLVQETGKHPAQLKDEVCSPGGTTIAGIQTLERAAFRSCFIDAVDSTAKRAAEIAELQKSKEK